MRQTTNEVERELARLLRRVEHWSPTRWTAMAKDGRPRSDVAHELVCRLVELGRQAGGDAPPGAIPPRLAPHGLADQLRVVGWELTSAPGLSGVAESAVRALRRADALL